MSVGMNIRKLRELRNYTQTHVSEKLNMSLSGYSKIERDETEISITRLEQIAEALETDIKTILSFDQDKIFNIQQYHADNGNQSGYVNTQKNFDARTMEILINQLKSENDFLRELIKSK